MSIRISYTNWCACGMLFIVTFLLFCNMGSAEVVSIKGSVKFADGEVPLFGTLTIAKDEFAKQVAVNEDGMYSISDLPEGVYQLLAHGVTETRGGIAMKENIEITKDTSLPIVLDIILSEPVH